MVGCNRVSGKPSIRPFTLAGDDGSRIAEIIIIVYEA